MTFLRTLFWIVVAVLVILFAGENGTLVTVVLWGDMLMDTRLSFLVVAAFLLGLVPSLVAYYTLRWRYRRLVARTAAPRVETTAPPPASEPALQAPGLAG